MDYSRSEWKGRHVAVRLADYYSRHVRWVIFATVGIQFMVTAALVTLLLMAGLPLLLVALYIVLPVVTLQIFAFIVILRFALSPLDSLTRVITHVSREANAVKPPNLNGTYHERTGLKRMVDTIYELAVDGPKRPETDDSTALERSLLKTMPAGIIAIDAERNITYHNDSAPVHTDKDGNKSLQLLFEADDSFDSWLRDVEANALLTRRAWSRIQNVLPDEPSRRVYDVIANYQKNSPSGQDTILVTIDRTEHYATDEEDMDFIALAAHELRGPITVIRGYLDILGNEMEFDKHPDHRQLLERLSVSAARLSGYIGNIMNVAKYDRRHLKLHLTEDRMIDVYATVVDDLQLRASTQGRLLVTNIPDDLPTIAADRNSLSEVIANLVDNAIKYSNEGGQVMVTATVDGNFVKLMVQDNGIGIPSSVVGHLFTKFYRSHRSRSNVAGTGLGLYISKAIIESHGGKMGVSSVEGQGSVFSFSVPIYSTVADKLLTQGQDGIIHSSSGWIKNHSMYEG